MLTVTKLTQALAIAGVALIGGNALADGYAVSTDNVRSGSITPTGDITFGAVSSTSSTSATLNGAGAANQSSGVPNPDAPVSAVGSASGRTNELGSPYYTLIGSGGSSYSWGDAIVNSEQTAGPPPTLIIARNAAETNIDGSGFGAADGTNKSSTSMTVAVGGSGSSLSFAFEANPFINVSMDAAAGPTSVARGTLGFSITLARASDGAVVFNWTPDGMAGGITGGSESADPFSLNLTLSAFAGQDFTYSGAYGDDSFGSFAASTDTLAAGVYTLSLFMNEKTDVVRVAAVPEPETYALMLGGLGLVGFIARRRRKV